jgi:signal transduction histidine kinase
MRLRTRLLALSVSTVAVIVIVLFALHLDSLTQVWIDNAIERSNDTGKQIQALIALRIADAPQTGANNLAQTKRNWNRMIAADRGLATMLVEQAAAPSGVIVEINVIGEDGKVLLSSIPARQGQVAPATESLAAIRDSVRARFAAVTTSTTDYETRIPIGIPDQPGPVFEIQLLVSPELLQDNVERGLYGTALASLLALFAAAGLAVISTQLALRPIRRIGRAIDTLSAGRPLGLSQPEENTADREVAAVEYKLSLLGEKMQGARRDAIGTLVRTVAHEIKNPLNAISLRLETLRMRIADEAPDAEPEIDLVSNEVHRLDRVVRTFLDLNQPLELNIQDFDPCEVASSVLETMRPAATEAGVTLQLVGPPRRFTVRADRGLIEQGLLNVVTNAIQATDRGGSVKASVSLLDGVCEIAVADNGPGMSASVREKIFEPFFTTKPAGSGIGLAFTKRSMELHGGGIGVESSPGSGTTMTLTFPAARRQS